MRLTIHYKITLIIVIIYAIILLGAYLYLNNNLREHTYQRIRTTLHKETSLAKTILEKYISEGIKYQELDSVADEIGKDLNLRVTIINLAGTVLGDSELNGKRLAEVENHLYRPEVQDALRSGSGESRRFSTTVNKNMLYFTSIFGKGVNQGIIRLSIPLSDIEVISSRLKRLLAASLIFAFIAVIIIGYLASIFISKPIREMSWIAKNIAKGDFSKRITFLSNDEIGDLAKAFNYMTEQIRARIEEVITSKSRLEAVLFSMFEGVIVVDSQGSILLMNKTLKDFLLIKGDPLEKKPLEVIRNIEIQDIADRALKLKGGVETREILLLLPEEKILLVHATPIIHKGIVDGAVLVFHDITELRKLEKIRQDFVANVSHELRTPVTNIKGYAETLLAGALDDKKNAKDFLKIISSDSDRLARLIDDLLDLSKIESGKLTMSSQPYILKLIVERVIAGLKKQARDKSISIKVDIPQNLPKILVDEIQIAQVLLNLIDNAIKYNKEEGTIMILAKERDNFIKVDISDTGIGISEKDLPRIFERFYRVDKARSRDLGGTGLGLSIVKHIIQAHSGEVSAQSVLGQGSTFSFTLPKA